MPTYRRFSLSLVVSLLASGAFAEGQPLGGRVFNLELNQRIHYSCTPFSETELECDFTEATVSQLLPADKIKAYRSDRLKEIEVTAEELVEFSQGMCEALERLDTATANGEANDIKYMHEADRKAVLQAFTAVCEKKDKASLEALVEFDIAVRSRTCMVSTFGWQARFAKSDEKTWVRTDKDAPDVDGCAGVNLDRFELAKDGYLWNLTRLSVATNPNGTFTTGQQCSEIYTGKEVKYQWQGNDLPARCDYIRLNLYD